MARHDRRQRGGWAFDDDDLSDEFAIDDLDDPPLDPDEDDPPQAQRSTRPRPARPRSRAQRRPADDVDDIEFEHDEPQRPRDRKRVEVSEGFKCRHCKAFIGIPPSGGRNRNHCPLCLYSLHVDGKTPGDRASDCRSLMAPIGTFYRPNGEQMVVHRCLGCGFVRYNRIAADDNPIVLADLPLVEQPAPNESVPGS